MNPLDNKINNLQIKKEMNLASSQQIKSEMDLHNKLYFSPNEYLPKEIDFSLVQQRRSCYHFERFSNFPQNIFFFTLLGKRFIGRKTISPLKIQNKIEELNCSRIQAHMILGMALEEQMCENGINVFYAPLKSTEKLFLFNALSDDRLCNITYPYVYLSEENKRERRSPRSGWKLNHLRAKNLGFGEKIIRDYSLQYLSKFDMTNKIVFDPACSTGEFLHTIKRAFPECKTIGQDLSSEMVDYARKYVDEIHCGNSINSPIPDSSVDFLFLRFLNSEVTTRSQAKQLFENLIKKCKENGYVILFGHTPILLSYYDLKRADFNIKQTLGYNKKNHSVFQYYVLKKSTKE